MALPKSINNSNQLTSALNLQSTTWVPCSPQEHPPPTSSPTAADKEPRRAATQGSTRISLTMLLSRSKNRQRDLIRDLAIHEQPAPSSPPSFFSLKKWGYVLPVQNLDQQTTFIWLATRNRRRLNTKPTAILGRLIVNCWNAKVFCNTHWKGIQWMTWETTMLTAKLICCHTRTYKTMATLFCLGVNNVATRWTQSVEPLNLSRCCHQLEESIIEASMAFVTSKMAPIQNGMFQHRVNQQPDWGASSVQPRRQ